jgi:hypothetical protein
VPLDPSHRGTAVFEDTGRKPCVLTVEDPDFGKVALGISGVLVHGKNVSRPHCRRPQETRSFAAPSAVVLLTLMATHRET